MTDGDSLDYLVLYSFDDRASWRTSGHNPHQYTRVTIDTGQLEGTNGSWPPAGCESWPVTVS